MRIGTSNTQSGYGLIAGMIAVMVISGLVITYHLVNQSHSKNLDSFTTHQQVLYAARSGVSRAQYYLANENATYVPQTVGESKSFSGTTGNANYFVTITRKSETEATSESTDTSTETGELVPTSFTISGGEVIPNVHFNAHIKIIGCAFSYGGGPSPVTAKIRAGSTWHTPWGEIENKNNDINDDNNPRDYTISDLEAGTGISIKARSFDAYNRTVDSKNEYENQASDSDYEPYCLVLRNGDVPPKFDPAQGQQTVEELLEDYIDSSTGTITLEDHQVIYIFELGFNGDFQDMIALVSLEESTNISNETSTTTTITGTEIDYTTVKDQDHTFKFEDATSQLGENSAQETHYFTVNVENDTNTVTIETKAATTSAQTIHIDSETKLTDTNGFETSIFSVESISATQNKYIFAISSMSNAHALSHVTFDFGSGATVLDVEGSGTAVRTGYDELTTTSSTDSNTTTSTVPVNYLGTYEIVSTGYMDDITSNNRRTLLISIDLEESQGGDVVNLSGVLLTYDNLALEYNADVVAESLVITGTESDIHSNNNLTLNINTTTTGSFSATSILDISDLDDVNLSIDDVIQTKEDYESSNSGASEVIFPYISAGQYINAADMSESVVDYILMTTGTNEGKIYDVADNAYLEPASLGWAYGNTVVSSSTALTHSVQIDFGKSSIKSGGNWNDMTSYGSGNSKNNLKDSQGNATGVSIYISDGFKANSSNGYTSNSMGYPSNASKDYFYVSSSNTTGKVRISGLDPTSTYNITLYGGSSTSASPGRVTEYHVNNETKYLTSTGNNSETVTFTDLTPGDNGYITVRVRRASGSSYGYLSTMILTENIPETNADEDDDRWNLNDPASAGSGFYYCDKDVLISADLGTLTENFPLTVATSGHLEVTGKVYLEASKNDLVLLADKDIAIVDNTEIKIVGMIMAGEHFKLTSTYSDITGLIVAGGVDGTDTTGNLASSNLVKGHQTLTPSEYSLYMPDSDGNIDLNATIVSQTEVTGQAAEDANVSTAQSQ